MRGWTQPPRADRRRLQPSANAVGLGREAQAAGTCRGHQGPPAWRGGRGGVWRDAGGGPGVSLQRGRPRPRDCELSRAGWLADRNLGLTPSGSDTAS